MDEADVNTAKVEMENGKNVAMEQGLTIYVSLWVWVCSLL
jgi:hypothetical protein